jgi:protein-L-isoaspartate(D-aspartate) O-methyltransferase
VGDGGLGWPEAAPFDGIIVTAAAVRTPPALIEQLAPSGRLIIPIGGEHDVQHLHLLRKDAAGGLRDRELCAVRFVPLRSGGVVGLGLGQ